LLPIEETVGRKGKKLGEAQSWKGEKKKGGGEWLEGGNLAKKAPQKQPRAINRVLGKERGTTKSEPKGKKEEHEASLPGGRGVYSSEGRKKREKTY